jgi:predicted metallo-beta-lactamase superfamily hydrolase
MQVIPLAADSMGVRSMATFVETRDIRLLIDPGTAIAERCHGLPPHPLETACLKKLRERVALYVKSAHVVVITQYSEEHFSPDHPEKYRDKILLIKNPNLNVRPDRRTLAFEFIKTVRNLAAEITFADGREFAFGKTRLVFSDFIPMKPAETREGAIPLAVQGEDEETFCYSSGTRGVYPEGTAAFLADQHPTLLYLDGPITHQTERTQPKISSGLLFKRIKKIVLDSGAPRVILDHHVLRNQGWRRCAEPLYQIALAKGITLQTAAEYRGEENLELEAGRKRLYELHPNG